MCTREEVKQLLEENNIVRNANLQKKLDEQTEKFFAHTSKLLQHQQSSPNTAKELTSIKQNCFTRGVELKSMNERLDEIVEKQEKQDEKLDQILSSLETKFVSKVEFWPVRALVYGMVAIILVGFMTAIVANYIK